MKNINYNVYTAPGGGDHDLVSFNKLSPENNSRDNVFFDNLVWLTTEEARIYLRLSSKEALRQLVYRGVIRSPYKLGRNNRFKRSDLDMFLESSRLRKRRV